MLVIVVAVAVVVDGYVGRSRVGVREAKLDRWQRG